MLIITADSSFSASTVWEGPRYPVPGTLQQSTVREGPMEMVGEQGCWLQAAGYGEARAAQEGERSAEATPTGAAAPYPALTSCSLPSPYLLLTTQPLALADYPALSACSQPSPYVPLGEDRVGVGVGIRGEG